MITEVDSQRTENELQENLKFGASPSTDEDLVAAARLGDHQAFWELWTRHSSRALNTTYRITRSREDAEDAVQDAWIKAYQRLNSFDGRAQFATWLTRIAINSSLMILRRKRARRETSMDLGDGDTWQQWEIADPAKSPEELHRGQERAERLKRAISRLHPTLRSIVEIHQSEDCSVKEVAELAGISLAATKSRLLRARKILRKTLS